MTSRRSRIGGLVRVGLRWAGELLERIGPAMAHCTMTVPYVRDDHHAEHGGDGAPLSAAEAADWDALVAGLVATLPPARPVAAPGVRRRISRWYATAPRPWRPQP